MVKTQKTYIGKALKKARLMASFLALFAGLNAYAQQNLVTTGEQKVDFVDTVYVDYLVPDHMKDKSLYLEARGADGGEAKSPSKTNGGEGATIKGYINIGNATHEIPTGSIIRFIVGEAGQSGEKHGGGGGGTAVAFQKPNETNWHLLMVAGGGGGSGKKYSGRYAEITEGGSNGIGGGNVKLDNAGSNGEGGTAGSVAADSYAGGGAYTAGERGNAGDAGYNDEEPKQPVGGAGGKSGQDDQADGGFGFGGGGVGYLEYFYFSGGGGGGYSGGGGGKRNGGGGGGGSYVNSTALMNVQGIKNSRTGEPADGYIIYKVVDKVPDASIRPSADNNKCLDVKNASTANGTGIRLRTCNGASNQRWFFQEKRIASGLKLNKCLDLNANNYTNGTNLHLWSCTDTHAQQWIYDGVSRQIRSWINWYKCLDRKYDNIRIWDCKDGSQQQWQVDEAAGKATGEASSPKTVYPYPTGKHNKCLGIYGKYASSNNCSGKKDQQWLFDGVSIKYADKQNKCLRLENRNTSNYTHIQLWDCDGNDKTQRWIYDGITGTIRYWENKKKCMALNGTYVSIMDCDGSPLQQWGVKDVDSN